MELVPAWAWENRKDTAGLYDGEAQGHGSSPATLTKISSVVLHLLLEMDTELWQKLCLETVLETTVCPALQQGQFVNCVTLRSGGNRSRGHLAQNRQTLGSRKPCAKLIFYCC